MQINGSIVLIILFLFLVSIPILAFLPILAHRRRQDQRTHGSVYGIYPPPKERGIRLVTPKVIYYDPPEPSDLDRMQNAAAIIEREIHGD